MAELVVAEPQLPHGGRGVAAPTTPRPFTSVRACATARVPAAKGASSNTPIGPFQNTVEELSMSSAKCAEVSGPMSSPIPLAPKGVASIESAGATT